MNDLLTTQGIRINHPALDDIPFPCWVLQEGSGATLWSHWWRCESRGHLLASIGGYEMGCADYPARWHPDQPSEPSLP